MKRSWRAAAIVAAVLLGMLGLAAFGSRLTVDAGAYRDRIEAAASDPLGLRVSVLGRLGVAFTGDLVLDMRDVHVRNARGDEVLSANRATIAVSPFPLLLNRCWVRRIALTNPRISVERGSDGVLNWSLRATPRGRLPVLAWASLSLTGGSFRYGDERSGAGLEATDVNAEVGDLRRANPGAPGFVAAHSFRASLRCGEIRTKTVSVSDLSAKVRARNGTVELDPLTMRVFGGKGQVTLRADLADSIPRYRLRGTLSQFRINQCLQTLAPDTIATGTMDFAANVSGSGRMLAEWTRSLEGDVSLRGKQIELRGHDLDHDASLLHPNQLLDLAGVGSVFFVGPVGVAAAKGYNLARLVGPSKGDTQIREMVSSWDVRGGELKAKDVALATNKNRIALRGNLDFVHQRFDSVTVALIDKEGCPKVRQELRGTFQKPELTKPTILSSLIAPARTVYTGVKDLIPGGPCTVFYAGSVGPPE